MALLLYAPLSNPRPHFLNPNPSLVSRFSSSPRPLCLELLYRNKGGWNFRCSALVSSHHRNSTPSSSEIPQLLHVAASAIFLLSFGARACTALPLIPPATCQSLPDKLGENLDDGFHPVDPKSGHQIVGKFENTEDKELKVAFEAWKSKTYALTVPLRIVALRGSIPPSWDFMKIQGRRLKLQAEYRGNLKDIFSDLSLAAKEGRLEPKSAMAADIATMGDSWLSLAVNEGTIEPIHDVEGQDWFNSLNEKWKVYLRRNNKGDLDSDGKIWGAPYRWGSMVIAYKENKFRKHNLAPIEDWGDLWRPELAGKISMVDAPREVVGAVLKYMGASYNTKNIDSQVPGGRNAVMQNLQLLQRQVRLFDSVHYLKAFGAGDVWVTVGWSSDVLPTAKRMSNVALVIPKSGASLWADLWVIPAATRFITNRIGGRVRSPSPLIHQWIDFCLQTARALPFRQEVIPGATPLDLGYSPFKEVPQVHNKGKPKLDTNLIAGIPPPDILARCEFLEPLSEEALVDYQWLIAGMREPRPGWIKSSLDYITSIIRTFRLKPRLS
ncbi:putrescine-binding periplasmic protein-like protein isoform X2 [Tasmannia lanceolata]|uniref:putrescine-binding periplasmic protein-like protein isoform X2 n=1 Tax=Tasmannia lanceolata TaxID=3420 RepID=UPI0040637F9C